MAHTMSKMTRKKTLGGLVALLVIYFAWHGFGMFGLGEPEPPPPPPPMPSPKPATLPTTAQEAAASPQVADLAKMQQDLQNKYITALNELQMLKLSRDIANANNDIITAKLTAVTTEKKIIDLLTTPTSAPPPAAASAAPSPAPADQQAQAAGAPATNQPAVTLSVVSVTQLQQKWTAVVSDGTNLFNMRVGDIVPADGSKIVAIDKSGVTLEKNGMQMKLSMVSVI